MNQPIDIDVLVIGAGPSGTTAAAWLAGQGHRVAIVERSRFPRLVVGESLLPISMGHWEEAGLLPALQRQGYAVKRGARFYRDGRRFDLAFDEGCGKEWNWTWQVPRSHFDQVLAQATMEKGVPIHFGHEAISVEFDQGKGVRLVAKGPDGEQAFNARFLIDSSGYGGSLVKLLQLNDARANNGRMALFTHVPEGDARRALFADPMQISFEVLERELWLWSIPFSNGDTSIGLVGHRDHFADALANGSTDDAMRHLLKRSEAFHGRFNDVPFKFPTARIDEYAHYNHSLSGPGYVLTGNCAGFLDPVFSSGVAFATESGSRAAKLVHRQLNGEAIDWKTEYEDHIRAGAAVFSSFIEDWYSGDLQDVFFTDGVESTHKGHIISVLAGYVWDRSNPYVAKHERAVKTLAKAVRLLEKNRALLP